MHDVGSSGILGFRHVLLKRPVNANDTEVRFVNLAGLIRALEPVIGRAGKKKK